MYIIAYTTDGFFFGSSIPAVREKMREGVRENMFVNREIDITTPMMDNRDESP